MVYAINVKICFLTTEKEKSAGVFGYIPNALVSLPKYLSGYFSNALVSLPKDLSRSDN